MKLFTIILFLFLTTNNICIAKEKEIFKIAPDTSKINIFIDCATCDISFLKTEIQYVNHVRDSKLAQVYILISSQLSGSGGKEFTLTFLGQQNFKNLNDTLKYYATNDASQLEINEGTINILQVGLLNYIKKTRLMQYMDITCKEVKSVRKTDDRWKGWIFNNNLNFFITAQTYSQFYNQSFVFSADKVTEKWKHSISSGTNFTRNVYLINEHKFLLLSKNVTINGLTVGSINRYCSLGGAYSMEASSFNNKDLSLKFAPAFEYDIWPYEIFIYKQFRIQYQISSEYVLYHDTTIYDKIKEQLFSEGLSATSEMKQKWGSFSFSVTASHYLHDFTKNRLSLSSTFYFRVFVGFSFYLSTSYSIIHDQLALPKLEATEEEILLQKKELATEYYSNFSIGINYSFGSRYNNIVNPRFGR